MAVGAAGLVLQEVCAGSPKGSSKVFCCARAGVSHSFWWTPCQRHAELRERAAQCRPHMPWGRRRVPGMVGIICSCVRVSSAATDGEHLMEKPHLSCTSAAHGTCCSIPHEGQRADCIPSRPAGAWLLPIPFQQGKWAANPCSRPQDVQPTQQPASLGLPAPGLNPCSHGELHTNVLMVTESSPNSDFN